MKPSLSFRPARAEDVPAIVHMLANDSLGAGRECLSEPLPESYFAAFAEIDRDRNNALIVAADAQDQAVAVLQLTFIPYLTFQGSWRALIEGVRVHPSVRGRGVGRQLLQRAIAQARERGCRMVQLTTDKRRPDALRFYQDLGFVASHEGLKLLLDPLEPQLAASGTGPALA